MPPSSVGANGHPHTCATCGKQYQRSAHLRRHETTHIEAPRFKCLYCEKTFGRRDVCRKHTVNCPNKTDEEAIPNLKRGQKPRACDACFHSKQSCDTSEPCDRCVSRKLPCTYRRLEDTPSAASDSSSPSSLATTVVGTPTNKGHTKIAVSFLLGLTNPNSENILEYLAGEAASRTEGDGLDPNMKPAFTPPSFPSSMLIDHEFNFLPYGLSSTFIPDALDFQALEGLPDVSSFMSKQGLPDASAALSPAITSPYDPKAFQFHAASIVSELHGLHNSLVSTDQWYRGSFDLATAASVFSPENLCVYAATYFRVSHLDFPIIHRPTFGTDHTTMTLVLSVALAGSLRAPPRDDAVAARGFLTLGEEYVFRRLQSLMPPDSTPEYTHELMETLQAAMIIHAVQFFRNDMATRRKNRTHRLPLLVSTVRCLGLAQTRHTPVFQYDEFVRNESRIRLAMGVTLADWQQCGMFNSPPTMTPTEMTCDLMCPLELWDAKDANEYFEAAQTHGFNPSRRIVSIKLCVDALMGETCSGYGSFPFQDINAIDMQALIFAISAMVISANLMGALASCSQSFMRAISRWEGLWDALRSRTDPAKFEKFGLVRYNSELCWVAKKIIKVVISGDRSSAYLQKVGHDSLVELHEFVRQYCDV